jgi:hypothetical protein
MDPSIATVIAALIGAGTSIVVALVTTRSFRLTGFALFWGLLFFVVAMLVLGWDKAYWGIIPL